MAFLYSDTKLTGKSLVAEMTAAAPTLCTTPQGRRSLLHLLNPRNPRHFPPALTSSLASTDHMRSKTSKKAPEIRTEEIRKAASEGLIAFVEKEGVKVSLDPGGSLVVAEIMLYAEGAKATASEVILSCLAAPYPSSQEQTPHPIDFPHTSRLIKTLLQGGHFSQSTKSVVPCHAFSASDFAAAFMKIVGRDTTTAIASGDGAFVIVELLERVASEGSEEDKSLLRQWFDENTRNQIEQGDMKGKQLLLQKLRTSLA